MGVGGVGFGGGTQNKVRGITVLSGLFFLQLYSNKSMLKLQLLNPSRLNL